MSSQTFLSLRFERIENRFDEVRTLLNYAESNQSNEKLYQTFCRSAHVLLVSHFEGLYKEICKDVLDDINANTTFNQVPKVIMQTHCNYFIQNNESAKSAESIRNKLIDAFSNYTSKLEVAPFLLVDNKNPTPEILEKILSRFGIKNFFWSIKDSDLDIVFEDLKTETIDLRNKLLRHLIDNTKQFPYTTDCNIYNPKAPDPNEQKRKTLWEVFINNFLKGRHNIVHGHVTDNPYDHEALTKAMLNLEILLYVYMINICSSSSPIVATP